MNQYELVIGLNNKDVSALIHLLVNRYKCDKNRMMADFKVNNLFIDTKRVNVLLKPELRCDGKTCLTQFTVPHIFIFLP